MSRSDRYLPMPQRITLNKTRVAAWTELGPQMVHDMSVRFSDEHEAFMRNNIVMLLESQVMTYQDGMDKQYVWANCERDIFAENFADKRVWLGAATVLTASSLALALLGFWLVAVIIAIFSTSLLALALAQVPSKVNIRKQFALKAQRNWRFPKNTIVFPETLGTPVIQIQVDAEEAGSN